MVSNIGTYLNYFIDTKHEGSLKKQIKKKKKNNNKKQNKKKKHFFKDIRKFHGKTYN